MSGTQNYTVYIFVITSYFMINVCAHAQVKTKNDRFRVATSFEYGTELLNWSIAGQYSGGDYVNILSELKWKRVATVAARANLECKLWKGLSFKATFEKGTIINGTVTDTDFAQNNRRDTTFHESFDANKGNTGYLTLGLGYEFKLFKKLAISPTLGYTRSTQLLYMLRDLGNVQGNLRSNYKTNWQGVVLAADLGFHLTKRIVLEEYLSYHQVDYNAVADWNLIQEFKHPVSFRHDANGYGITNEFTIRYLFSETLSIHANVNHASWKTGKGIDTLYLVDGTINRTQLNGVEKRKLGVALGVALRF